MRRCRPKPMRANCVIAYEPVWAIGTGKVPSVAEIDEMHVALRQRLVGGLWRARRQHAHPLRRVGQGVERSRNFCSSQMSTEHSSAERACRLSISFRSSQLQALQDPNLPQGLLALQKEEHFQRERKVIASVCFFADRRPSTDNGDCLASLCASPSRPAGADDLDRQKGSRSQGRRCRDGNCLQAGDGRRQDGQA